MDEKTNNLVAKHARTYNKSNVMKDRKKAKKKGYQKHKAKMYEGEQHTNSAARKPQVYTDQDGKRKVKMVPAHRDVETENFAVTHEDEEGKTKVKKTYPNRQAARAHANKENEKKPDTHSVTHKNKLKESLDDLQERPDGYGNTTYTTPGMRKKALQNPKVAKRVADVQKREKDRKTNMSSDQKRELRKRQKAGRVRRYLSNNDRADARSGNNMESVEEKKGLWHNIRQKRNRGERPAKPGEKGYPKTLDVGEGLAQAKKNVGADNCWDGYKAKGTKMKGGKEVPDCKKEEKYPTSRKPKVIPAPKSDMSKRMARGQRNDPVNKIRAKKPLAGYPEQGKIDIKLTKEETTLSKVEIDGLPTMYVDGSPAQVSVKLRKMLKKKDDIKSVERATKVDARKAYRARSVGKEVEEGTIKTANKAKKNRIDREAGHQFRKDNPDMVGRPGPKHKGYGAQATAVGRALRDEDTMSRAREVARLKDKHKQEREQEKAAAERIKNQDRGPTNESLDPIDKRKYENLKRRVKSGDRAAKKQLAAFEKEHELDLRGKSAAKSKKVSTAKRGTGDLSTQQGYSGKGSGTGNDDQLIMQLRKAQDLRGNMLIKPTSQSKGIKLPKNLIDKLLTQYDRLQTPSQRKKMVSMISHEIRKRTGDAGPKMKKADNTPPPRTYTPSRSYNMKGAGKLVGKSRSIRAPKKSDRETGPSAKDLRNM